MARKLQMKHNLYQSSRSKGYVELISSLGQDGLTSVNAARASFGIEKEELSDKDIKLLKYCMKEKHTSIFEHNVITFRFKVPLFVARQHMRHRTWSFNEISRRYTKVDIDFYEPITFRTQHKSNRQASLIESAIDPILYTIKGEVLDYDCTASEALRIHRKNALQLYNQMINNGIAREQARMVLPQSMITEWLWSGTLYAFARVCNLRCKPDVQKETREVADQISYHCEQYFPISWKYLIDKQQK